MEWPWIPRILCPDFAWPRPIAPKIATMTPPIPHVASRTTRRFWGLIHAFLARFSKVYCSWLGYPFTPPIMDLPFGLILKWSERVRIEEVAAMKMARAAGMPVPRVLSYGEHPSDWRSFSILMTRLPGYELQNSRDPFLLDEEQPWASELGKCLNAMRQWKIPFADKLICSSIGTSVSSQRVPNHDMGPFKSEKEFHEYLLSPASSHSFASSEEYHVTLAQAKRIFDASHRVVFTHGDLYSHNILVDENLCLTGFLDWEAAGWCPEYWEFSAAARFGKGTWWHQGILAMGGDQYLAEMECDRALNKLTADAYVSW